MALDSRQAFKTAYLLALAERGLSEDEIAEKVAADCRLLAEILEKRATMAGAAGSLAGSLVESAKPFGLAGLAGAVMAPPVAGMIAGHGLAKLTDADAQDVEDAQKQEILAELRRASAQINQNREAQAFRVRRAAPPLRAFHG